MLPQGPIRDLTMLHRKPLNIGETAKERKAFAKENRKLDPHEEAMRGDDHSREPVLASWWWPAVVAFFAGLTIGVWVK